MVNPTKAELDEIKQEFRNVALQISKIAPASAEKMKELFARVEELIRRQNEANQKLVKPNAIAIKKSDEPEASISPRKPGQR